MAQISAASLLTLIQIVDREIAALREAAAENPGADFLAEMRAYATTAEELATAYAEATRGLSNYPPYSELVSRLDLRD